MNSSRPNSKRINSLKQIYRTSLASLTDLYQLTMAYSAWKTGADKKEAVFDLYFRSKPFGNGYAVACGLEHVLDLIENFHFEEADCEFFGSLKGNDGLPLFENAFIEFLKNIKLSVEVDAIAEGRVVFDNEPLLRMTGPLYQCQLLETPLLAVMNFQTLIATKAARIKQAAGSDVVLEFGLRRAQGIDGALTASRAAFVGGADATSNLLAARIFDIPVRGTHAHSWVMAFEGEEEAFMKFAQAMPNNAVFLVDTYDTILGVKNAIRAGLWLKSNGHQMLGIRLDSGDLAYLSIEARKLLDAAGLQDAKIVASNDLDENIISSLKAQGAKIAIWGVGTKLVTGNDQPALGGVFKLVALRDESKGDWQYRIKLSEQINKVTTPGVHQVRRFYDDSGQMTGDMIFDLLAPPTGDTTIVDPKDPTRQKVINTNARFEDLLQPVVKNGQVIISRPVLSESKGALVKDLKALHQSHQRFLNPHEYPVGLELGLHNEKSRMILERRRKNKES